MTLYKVALHLCQLLALVSQSQKIFVSAHGYLTIPRARNNEDYCAHCLNAGGPQTVYAGNAYTHGICGNNAADHPQNWNEADQTNIEPIGQSGDSVLLEVTVTAHHMGFFEFELCNSPDISEECFRERRLMRSNCDPEVEGELQCRRWWKPLKQEEYNHYSLTPQGYPDEAPYISDCSFVSFATYFDLPEDVDCTHCVLRWHYVTTNSCTSDESTGEEFWNCADVSIAAPGGQTTTDTAPAEGYASMNERLTMKVPQDLTDLMVDGVDNWRCPNPAYGTPGEYFCGIDGDVSGTDGCYAAKSEETCTISFYESDIEPVQEGIPDVSYCTWSDVCLENGEGGSDWCDWDESNCNSCGGQWCFGWDLLDSTEPSTTAQSTTTRQTTTFQTTTATTTITTTTTTSSTTTEMCTTTPPSDGIHELYSLSEIASVQDYADWSLISDGDATAEYRNDLDAVQLRNQIGGGTLSFLKFINGSECFNFYSISVTLEARNMKQVTDLCAFEASTDGGVTWLQPPIFETAVTIGPIQSSGIVSAGTGYNGLTVRVVVSGNSHWDACFLSGLHVNGLMSSTTTITTTTTTITTPTTPSTPPPPSTTTTTAAAAAATSTTTTATTTTTTTTRTTVGTTINTHVDTIDSHKDILDAIADVSSDVTALTAIAESLQAAIDAYFTYIQNVLVQGLGDMNATISTPLETRRLRGRQ